MITRSAGEATGFGYLVGNGYEGKTKELDNTVLKISKLIEKTFNRDVEIRYNSNRESGGAFIKDNNFSSKIGIGASLQNKKFQSMTTEEKIKLSEKEMRDLPNDIILFDAILDDSLSNNLSKKKDLYKHFKTLKGAFNWLMKNINNDAVEEYLKKLCLNNGDSK